MCVGGAAEPVVWWRRRGGGLILIRTTRLVVDVVIECALRCGHATQVQWRATGNWGWGYNPLSTRYNDFRKTRLTKKTLPSVVSV